MVAYLICFSLESTPEQQLEQIKFWLQFLNSSLPLQQGASQAINSRFTVMLVGLRADAKHPRSELTAQNITIWQHMYHHLNFYTEELFNISSMKSTESVAHLLRAVENECNRIFKLHVLHIPTSYHELLSAIRNLPLTQHFFQVEKIADLCVGIVDRSVLHDALKYLHSTGHVVLLDNHTVCIDPTIVPKIVAKFISPTELRRQLLKTGDVTILEDADIGCLLLSILGGASMR
jgi:hypothetical protein